MIGTMRLAARSAKIIVIVSTNPGLCQRQRPASSPLAVRKTPSELLAGEPPSKPHERSDPAEQHIKIGLYDSCLSKQPITRMLRLG